MRFETRRFWVQFGPGVLVSTSIMVFHKTKPKNKKNQISVYQKRLKTENIRVRVCLVSVLYPFDAFCFEYSANGAMCFKKPTAVSKY